MTGGPGGELRIVGKSVIGGAIAGVTDPDEIGKTEAGGRVTGLADADDTGDRPSAGLVPQAARPTVVRLAVITVKTCARVVRRMLVRRQAATQGSLPAAVRAPAGRAGPHPNKAYAAGGRRAHRLEPDPQTAPIVQWMLAQRLAGNQAHVRSAAPDTRSPGRRS